VLLSERDAITLCFILAGRSNNSLEADRGELQCHAEENRLLHKNKGSVTKAAHEAGKDRRCSFGRLIKKYEINRQAFG
jgi:hypothetical protein